MTRIALLVTVTLPLAACGGAGPTTSGGNAPPASGGGGSQPTAVELHTFVDPRIPKIYGGVGGGVSQEHTMSILRTAANPTGNGVRQDQGSVGYNSNATTVRSGGIQLSYDPRSAEFQFAHTDALASTTTSVTYVDPIDRTDFGGLRAPQYGVDNIPIPGMRYVQAGAFGGGRPYSRTEDRLGFILNEGAKTGSSDITTLFYQTPGTTTSYVTFAGFARNRYNVVLDDQSPYRFETIRLERGAFVYGEITPARDVPTTGTGTYNGHFLATVSFNILPDVDATANSFFQWLAGTSVTTLDFANASFTLALNGTIARPALDGSINLAYGIPEGSTFTASGDGQVDVNRFGGFQGRFNAAQVNTPGGTIVLGVPYLSGSTIDGTFYGPTAQEIGGGLRITGGVPDERIDIIGAFTGKR